MDMLVGKVNIKSCVRRFFFLEIFFMSRYVKLEVEVGRGRCLEVMFCSGKVYYWNLMVVYLLENICVLFVIYD